MDRLKQLEPAYLFQRERRLRRLAELGAYLVIAVCGAVLLIWTLRATWIDAAQPWILQMKPNSAAAFAAAGAALLLLLRARFAATGVLATVPLAIGLLTLAAYAGFPLGIDELISTDWSRSAGTYPGRPSPNTALVLAAIGAALALLAARRQGAARLMAVRLVSFVAGGIAIVSVAGRVADAPIAVGWGAGAMSVPSALSALLLAGGLLAHSWRSETTIITRMPIWIPALLCFALATLDVSTSRDVNIGICYIPLVFCALWFARANLVFAFAAIATALILIGLFASPPGQIAFEVAAFNRGLAVAAVWLVATLIYFDHLAQRKVRHAMHHLETIQTIAAIGSFELHFATMTFTASSSFDAMHGLAADDARDWETFVRQTIPPDERPAIAEMIDAARAGVSSRDLEYGFLRRDGTPRVALLHCDLLFDAEGRPAGIIGVVHDVTELRHAQARQADIEAQLRHARKLEALGTLAGGIAHDLNNTLVPITTLTPLLIETADAADRPVLEVVMGAARRAKELVREMLVFSRKDSAAHESVRLDQLVRESLTIIRAGIPTSIAIADELEDVPEIIGSKGQIYQTILNLVTNAAHAIGEQPGKITIGAAPDDNGGRRQVRLYVVDDGAGMDEATRGRIFEPLFSTKDAREGTGLGLSIVSGIAKSHGASISVTSELGRGTRFDLLFPVREVGAAA